MPRCRGEALGNKYFISHCVRASRRSSSCQVYSGSDRVFATIISRTRVVASCFFPCSCYISFSSVPSHLVCGLLLKQTSCTQTRVEGGAQSRRDTYSRDVLNKNCGKNPTPPANHTHQYQLQIFITLQNSVTRLQTRGTQLTRESSALHRVERNNRFLWTCPKRSHCGHAANVRKAGRRFVRHIVTMVPLKPMNCRHREHIHCSPLCATSHQKTNISRAQRFC